MTGTKLSIADALRAVATVYDNHKLPKAHYLFIHPDTREEFLEIVQAFKSFGLTKKFGREDVTIDCAIGPITVSASLPRKQLCKLVSEAVWECDPILDAKEVK